MWKNQGRLSRGEEAGCRNTSRASVSPFDYKAVKSSSFLLLHSKVERDALSMSLHLRMNGVSPLKAWAPGWRFWPPQHQTTSFFQGRCFIFIFFSMLRTFYNIFEQKEFLFSLLHTLAFVSHCNMKTREHIVLVKPSGERETASPGFPSLGTRCVAVVEGLSPGLVP